MTKITIEQVEEILDSPSKTKQELFCFVSYRTQFGHWDSVVHKSRNGKFKVSQVWRANPGYTWTEENVQKNTKEGLLKLLIQADEIYIKD